MSPMNKYAGVLCVAVSLAAATSAEAAAIDVSSWTPQFVGVALAKATILSDADSNVLNTSVAYIERIDLDAKGIGFTTTPASGPLETTVPVRLTPTPTRAGDGYQTGHGNPPERRSGFPQSVPEFHELFPYVAAYAAYLDRARWPVGFVWPYCGQIALHVDASYI